MASAADQVPVLFRAQFAHAALLKQVVDAIKDSVSETNLDCDASGMQMQGMDSSNVSLCMFRLEAAGFAAYRCDVTMAFGLSLVTLGKILKCAGNEDSVVWEHQRDTDVCRFVFQPPASKSGAPGEPTKLQMNLMTIDGAKLGMPDTVYQYTIRFSSKRFRDFLGHMVSMGCDTCTMTIGRAGCTVTATEQSVGTITVTLNPRAEVLPEKDAKNKDVELGVYITLTAKAAATAAPATASTPTTAATPATAADTAEAEPDETPVKLQFALRYLLQFSKATPLAEYVTLYLATEHPLMVEYTMAGVGFVRYYLAPKIDDDVLFGD